MLSSSSTSLLPSSRLVPASPSIRRSRLITSALLTVTPRTLPTPTNRLNLTGRAAPTPFASLQAFVEAHTPPTYIVRNLAAMGISEMSEVGRGAAAVMMAVSLHASVQCPSLLSLMSRSSLPTSLLLAGPRRRRSGTYGVRKDPRLPHTSPHSPPSARLGLDREVGRTSCPPPRSDARAGSPDPERVRQVDGREEVEGCGAEQGERRKREGGCR